MWRTTLGKSSGKMQKNCGVLMMSELLGVLVILMGITLVMCLLNNAGRD